LASIREREGGQHEVTNPTVFALSFAGRRRPARLSRRQLHRWGPGVELPRPPGRRWGTNPTALPARLSPRLTPARAQPLRRSSAEQQQQQQLAATTKARAQSQRPKRSPALAAGRAKDLRRPLFPLSLRPRRTSPRIKLAQGPGCLSQTQRHSCSRRRSRLRCRSKDGPKAEAGLRACRPPCPARAGVLSHQGTSPPSG
jgi:hypothetical protein